MSSPRTITPPKGLERPFAELQEIPNVGPATAEDLLRLGVRKLEDLKGRDPLEMYDAISRLDGVRHDPCVLDVFMAIVHFAKTGHAKPWWNFTASRKKMLEANGRSG